MDVNETASARIGTNDGLCKGKKSAGGQSFEDFSSKCWLPDTSCIRDPSKRWLEYLDDLDVSWYLYIWSMLIHFDLFWSWLPWNCCHSICSFFSMASSAKTAVPSAVQNLNRPLPQASRNKKLLTAWQGFTQLWYLHIQEDTRKKSPQKTISTSKSSCKNQEKGIYHQVLRMLVFPSYWSILVHLILRPVAGSPEKNPPAAVVHTAILPIEGSPASSQEECAAVQNAADASNFHRPPWCFLTAKRDCMLKTLFLPSGYVKIAMENHHL